MKAVQVGKEMKLQRTNGVGRKIGHYSSVPIIQKFIKRQIKDLE